MLQMPKAVNKHAYPTDAGADDDDDDDEEERKERKKPAAKKAKESGAKKEKGARKSNMPRMNLSADLQAVVGQATASRPEVRQARSGMKSRHIWCSLES